MRKNSSLCKLSLSRDTLRTLSARTLGSVVGGAAESASCPDEFANSVDPNGCNDIGGPVFRGNQPTTRPGTW